MLRPLTVMNLFQSTPSVGRATLYFCRSEFVNFISIHALRGEGDGAKKAGRSDKDISIHALRGEGD